MLLIYYVVRLVAVLASETAHRLEVLAEELKLLGASCTTAIERIIISSGDARKSRSSRPTKRSLRIQLRLKLLLGLNRLYETLQPWRSTLSDNDLGFWNLLLQHLSLSQLLLLKLVLTPYGLLKTKRWKLIVVRVNATSIVEVINDLCVVVLRAELQLFRVLVESFLVFTSVRFTVDFSTLETSFEIWLGMVSAIGGCCPSNLLTAGLNLIS